MKSIYFYILLSTFGCTMLSFQGCKISYSFTGASISPAVKTISIQPFPNRAPIIQPSLSQDFTEALVNRFTSQTNLEFIVGNGDLNFEGEITGYDTRPMAIQQNEAAALNRLTVSVRVSFVNSKDEEQNFDKTFTAYSDYDSAENLDDVEDGLMKEILEKLTEDIFNEAVANW